MDKAAERREEMGSRRLLVVALIALGGLAAWASPATVLAQQYPPSSQQMTTSTSDASPGEVITVSGDGFAPGAGITITFESAPVTIGNAQADSSGRFTAQVRIPDDAEPGTHTIRATGTGADGGTRTITAQVTVRPRQAPASAFVPGQAFPGGWAPVVVVPGQPAPVAVVPGQGVPGQVVPGQQQQQSSGATNAPGGTPASPVAGSPAPAGSHPPVFTGANVLRFVASASALLVLGALLLVGARRRIRHAQVV
jgi:hypothetical protein